MATLEAVERCLIEEWDDLLAAEGRIEVINNALGDLGSTLAYLLNFFIERDPCWSDYGADDLLEIVYEFPAIRQMSVAGLMCWGDREQNYLSPFVGEFERHPKDTVLTDFVVYFAARGVLRDSYTIPYTRDEFERRRLFESRPRLAADWPHVYRRGNLRKAMSD
jgi:hypothetical protein